MPCPRLRTAVPRCRPSVGLRQTARQRPSPICWATSAVTVIFSPSSSMSISSAKLISGSASGGNSTSTTGPRIAMTHPSFKGASDSWVWGSAVAVMAALAPGVSSGLVVVLGGVHVVVVVGALAQCLGATDDLHDLRRDRVLPGPVHPTSIGEDQVFRVVGRSL